MTVHGVGIDVADPQRFAQLIDRAGDAFTSRWFSAREVAECRAGGPHRFAARVAVRYAAKEAVWKALGPDTWSGPVPWKGIAILDGEAPGRLDVVLSGAAAELAARSGVATIVVGVSSWSPAIAFAVAGLADGRRPL